MFIGNNSPLEIKKFITLFLRKAIVTEGGDNLTE